MNRTTVYLRVYPSTEEPFSKSNFESAIEKPKLSNSKIRKAEFKQVAFGIKCAELELSVPDSVPVNNLVNRIESYDCVSSCIFLYASEISFAHLSIEKYIEI